MKFSEVVVNTAAWLQREGRVSYRAIKLEFDLDDDVLDALKDELIDIKGLAVARDEKMLVWVGAPPSGAASDPRAAPAASIGAPYNGGLPSASELDTTAERRRLTVMFCDLVGSTALSEELDPEDLRRVIRSYQETAAVAVARHDGHIAQYLGDGVLVYFGYPRAHEDDARRAVATGLEIIEALQRLSSGRPGDERGLAVRIGIHTGLVVVGEMGGGGRREQLALGQTPNVAARIQARAEPNTVVISATTARLIGASVALQDLGSHNLPGVTEPIQMSRAVGLLDVHSENEKAGRISTVPLLAGRHEELGLLRQRWDQSKTGRGQTILISGEAGIGKTALVQTIGAYVLREGMTRITFHCSPDHQHSALYPVIKHLERAFRFKRGEAPNLKLAKLERILGKRHPLPLKQVVPLYAELLSVPLPAGRYAALDMSPVQQRQRTHDALIAWMAEETRRRPALIVWEDLHLADPSTLELAGLAMEKNRNCAALNILTYRREFVPPWRQGAHVTAVTLDRLDPSQVEVMITYLSGGKSLPQEVVDEIVNKTDGVPLYVEELTKMVMESDYIQVLEDRFEVTARTLPRLSIPPTLQDLLMARLDRSPEVREVAQLGAVFGREFSYEMIQGLSGMADSVLAERLTQLVDAELLYEQGRRPQAKYFFRQALIRDAAYESLLRSSRQHYHRQVAELFERRFADLVDAQPEVVAHHYTEAGQIETAIPHWLRAGERAVERSDNVEAIGHLTRGLDVLATLPDTEERERHELNLLMALMAPLMVTTGYASSDVVHGLERARELCRQLGETPQLFAALVGLWVLHVTSGSTLEVALELAEELLRLAEDAADEALFLQAHAAMATTLFYAGDLEAAADHRQRSLALYDPSRHHAIGVARFGLDLGVTGRSLAAVTAWLRGCADEARTLSAEAVALARQLDHPYSLGWALLLDAVVLGLRGETQLSAAQAGCAVDLARQREFALFEACGVILRCATEGAGADGFAAALAPARHSLELLRGSGVVVWLPFYLARVAQMIAACGDVDRALRLSSEAIELTDRRGEHWCEAELLRVKGELLLDEARDSSAGDPDGEAQAYFQKALELASDQGAKAWALRAATSLARLWHRQGRGGEARDVLEPVYESFSEGRGSRDLRDAESLLAALH